PANQQLKQDILEWQLGQARHEIFLDMFRESTADGLYLPRLLLNSWVASGMAQFRGTNLERIGNRIRAEIGDEKTEGLDNALQNYNEAYIRRWKNYCTIGEKRYHQPSIDDIDKRE